MVISKFNNKIQEYVKEKVFRLNECEKNWKMETSQVKSQIVIFNYDRKMKSSKIRERLFESIKKTDSLG